MSERKARKGRTRKVRYAVVGLGYVSQIALLPAFSHSREHSEVTALVSGDPIKLKSLARKYRIAHTYSYEQYADCLASGNIDAGYIALPDHMHRAYAEPAARAGIHILCEKPMAFEEAGCEAMIAEAEKAKVKLMIAYRLHFELGNLQAIQVVNSGKIGEPRIFTSSFSQQVRPGNSRLKKDLGGGPLYDLGVYRINAARYLFRAEPEQVFAWHSGGDGDHFREVPATTTAMLQFPGDRVASFTCSFGAADRSVFEVIGTKGVVRMDPAYEMVEALHRRSRSTEKPPSRCFDGGTNLLLNWSISRVVFSTIRTRSLRVAKVSPMSASSRLCCNRPRPIGRLRSGQLKSPVGPP
jgi:predicted dehydrogenase